MTITKDESIVAQVAGKIAADLVTTTQQPSVDAAVAAWATALDAVYNALSDMHGWHGNAVAAVQAAFPSAVEVDAVPAPQSQTVMSSTLRIKGTQHGPIPEWLITATRAAGVTEVWDNRDKLQENPKRPHFRAVTGDAAFWPPRQR